MDITGPDTTIDDLAIDDLARHAQKLQVIDRYEVGADRWEVRLFWQDENSSDHTMWVNPKFMSGLEQRLGHAVPENKEIMDFIEAQVEGFARGFVKIGLPVDAERIAHEWVWARPTEDGFFEIGNITQLAAQAQRGDIVEATPRDGSDSLFIYKRTVRRAFAH
jgi:hypothetical protein